MGAFYVLPYCNLVGDTDVSEEAVHFIFRVYEDVSSVFLWNFCTTFQSIRRHRWDDNSKYIASCSKGDQAGEKQTNKQIIAQQKILSVSTAFKPKTIFFYYSNSFRTHLDLENKFLLFSVYFLSNLQFPLFRSHKSSDSTVNRWHKNLFSFMPLHRELSGSG